MLKYLIDGRIFVCLDQHAVTNVDYLEQTMFMFLAEAYGVNRHSTVHNVPSIHIGIALPEELQEVIEIF